MLWYVVTFIAGVVLGMIMTVCMLVLLKNNRIEENDPDDDSVFNQDGTPKRIKFNKNDCNYGV